MPKFLIKKNDSTRYTLWVIISLTIVGIIATSARLMLSDQFKVSGGDTIWAINVEIFIQSAQKNDGVQIFPPLNTEHIRVIAQKLNHAGMRFVRDRADMKPKREIDLKVISEGKILLNAEFTTQLSTIPLLKLKPSTLPLTLEQRMEYLSSNTFINVESPVVISKLNSISATTEEKALLTNEIFSYVNSNIIKDTTIIDSNPDKALSSGHASTLGRARAMVALCRAAGIPARIISGFILEDSFDAKPYYWVELFQETGWVPYDPEKGYIKSIPNNFLPFNKGRGEIVASNKPVSISFDIEQRFDLVGLNLSDNKRVRDIFDLERFRPSIRSTLAIMLLLPFGALITTLIRSFLGIRGYGTFTPTLIALAAVYADWVVAVVLLAIVIALGATGRTIMPGKLVRVPRLSIVFTIVAMSMAMGVSLMEYLDYSQGAHVVLLPIVILTTLIDRFYSSVDENGLKLAVRRLTWTMIMAVICYLVLQIDELGYLLLKFPEIHFITLAIILLVSLYKGKKVCDFPYFYWLAEPKKNNRKITEDNPEKKL